MLYQGSTVIYLTINIQHKFAGNGEVVDNVGFLHVYTLSTHCKNIYICNIFFFFFRVSFSIIYYMLKRKMAAILDLARLWVMRGPRISRAYVNIRCEHTISG